MQSGDTPTRTVANPDPVTVAVTTPSPTWKLTVTAEHWQFFAFVFAAAVTLALALLDEMPDRLAAWRIAAKVVTFIGLGYLTLYNWTAKNFMLRVLPTIKTRVY
jgi:hypothetical protein